MTLCSNEDSDILLGIMDLICGNTLRFIATTNFYGFCLETLCDLITRTETTKPLSLTLASRKEPFIGVLFLMLVIFILYVFAAAFFQSFVAHLLFLTATSFRCRCCFKGSCFLWIMRNYRNYQLGGYLLQHGLHALSSRADAERKRWCDNFAFFFMLFLFLFFLLCWLGDVGTKSYTPIR